jgi:hypothetical protein
VGLIQHLRQAGARDVIVAAYGADAIKACENADAAIKLAGVAPASLQMVVGDRRQSVNLWQVDHGDWAGRYRHVYLDVVTPLGHTCRFDIAAGKVRNEITKLESARFGS